MFIKRFMLAALVAVICGTQAFADPSASLEGVFNEGTSQYDWTLSFDPDASIFGTYPVEGTGDSLGVSFQIEMPVGELVTSSYAINTTNFQESITGTDIITASYDPYTTDVSGISEGIQEYGNVGSDASLGFTGTSVDSLMVSLGSIFFTATGPYDALTFSTTGDTVEFGGLIAQDNNNGDTTDDIYEIMATSVTVGPGFSFADFNEDGFVDDLDLAAFFGQWGSMSNSFADFNMDNVVDDLDLAAFFGQWDPAPGAVASISNVPEPSTFVMVGLGLVGFGLIARRK